MSFQDYYCVEFHIDTVNVNSYRNWSGCLDLLQGRSFVSSSLMKWGRGLEATSYFVFLHTSCFSWAKVRSWRCCCSADSIRWIDIIVSVQFGAGASSVVRTCILPQVVMVPQLPPPRSLVSGCRIPCFPHVGSLGRTTLLSLVLLA